MGQQLADRWMVIPPLSRGEEYNSGSRIRRNQFVPAPKVLASELLQLLISDFRFSVFCGANRQNKQSQ